MRLMPDAMEWPPELDALIAAPQFHTLLFENDLVRVLETRIRPGERTPLHTHCWPGVVYVISWSDFIRRDAEGRVLADSRLQDTVPSGSAVWTMALQPHTLENVGEAEIRMLTVELKRENELKKEQ